MGLEKINRIANEVESQLQMSRSMLRSIREHVNKILNVENRIRIGIESAVMPVIRNVNAVSIGVSSFWKSYKLKQIDK